MRERRHSWPDPSSKKNDHGFSRDLILGSTRVCMLFPIWRGSSISRIDRSISISISMHTQVLWQVAESIRSCRSISVTTSHSVRRLACLKSHLPVWFIVSIGPTDGKRRLALCSDSNETVAVEQRQQSVRYGSCQSQSRSEFSSDGTYGLEQLLVDQAYDQFINDNN